MFSHYIKFNETIQVIPTLYCLSASLLLDHAVECGMTQTDIHTAQRWCERDLAPVVSNLSHYSTTPEDLHLVYQNYSGQWCDGNYSDSVIFTINWSITRHHIMCQNLVRKTLSQCKKNGSSILKLWLTFLIYMHQVIYNIMSCEMEVNREVTLMESPGMNCTS